MTHCFLHKEFLFSESEESAEEDDTSEDGEPRKETEETIPDKQNNQLPESKGKAKFSSLVRLDALEAASHLIIK